MEKVSKGDGGIEINNEGKSMKYNYRGREELMGSEGKRANERDKEKASE